MPPFLDDAPLSLDAILVPLAPILAFPVPAATPVVEVEETLLAAVEGEAAPVVVHVAPGAQEVVRITDALGDTLLTILPEAETEDPLPICHRWDGMDLPDVTEEEAGDGWAPPPCPARVALAALQALALPDPGQDGFFGLFTDPPGEWGILSYGKEKALILRGDGPFLRRALNLLSSFAAGRMDGPKSPHFDLVVREQSATGGRMIPMREAQIRRAFACWFYAQLYPLRAPADRHQHDEEGCFTDIRALTCSEDRAIMAEAEALSNAFYDRVEHQGLGCGFVHSNTTPPMEHALGSVLHSGADDGRD